MLQCKETMQNENSADTCRLLYKYIYACLHVFTLNVKHLYQGASFQSLSCEDRGGF